MADVEHDHLVDVLAPPTLLVELQWRDADALLENLGGAGVVGSVRRPADVALVRAVDGPEHHPLAVEHRHEGGQVGQMVAAEVGVVEQVDVARPYLPLEELVDRLGRKRQRTDVDGHMLGLGDQPPVGIAQRRREIPARVQDLRVGGAQHGLAHLLDDGAKAVLDHRHGDRIDGRAHGRVALGKESRGLAGMEGQAPRIVMPWGRLQRVLPPGVPACRRRRAGGVGSYPTCRRRAGRGRESRPRAPWRSARPRPRPRSSSC
jgi:hypothetical protein